MKIVKILSMLAVAASVVCSCSREDAEPAGPSSDAVLSVVFSAGEVSTRVYYDEIVISYTGTNSPTDIIFDDFGGIVLGNVPGQYTGALNFYNEILTMNNVSK